MPLKPSRNDLKGGLRGLESIHDIRYVEILERF